MRRTISVALAVLLSALIAPVGVTAFGVAVVTLLGQFLANLTSVFDWQSYLGPVLPSSMDELVGGRGAPPGSFARWVLFSGAAICAVGSGAVLRWAWARVVAATSASTTRSRIFAEVAGTAVAATLTVVAAWGASHAVSEHGARWPVFAAIPPVGIYWAVERLGDTDRRDVARGVADSATRLCEWARDCARSDADVRSVGLCADGVRRVSALLPQDRRDELARMGDRVTSETCPLGVMAFVNPLAQLVIASEASAFNRPSTAYAQTYCRKIVECVPSAAPLDVRTCAQAVDAFMAIAPRSVRTQEASLAQEVSMASCATFTGR